MPPLTLIVTPPMPDPALINTAPPPPPPPLPSFWTVLSPLLPLALNVAAPVMMPARIIIMPPPAAPLSDKLEGRAPVPLLAVPAPPPPPRVSRVDPSPVTALPPNPPVLPPGFEAEASAAMPHPQYGAVITNAGHQPMPTLPPPPPSAPPPPPEFSSLPAGLISVPPPPALPGAPR